MAGTFTSELASEGRRWAYILRVAGWGRLLNANSGDRRESYHLTTDAPISHGLLTVPETVAHLEMLRRPRGSIGDEVLLREGQTRLGELSLELLDLPIDEPSGEDHGWLAGLPLLSQLLADHAPASRWVLAADTTTTDPEVWTLVSRVGLVVDQMVHVDAEVARITVLGPGANQVTVARAQQGTTAAVHRTSSGAPPGEGILYSRPQYTRGREAWLYLNLYDTRTVGTTPRLLPKAQERLAWHGYVDDVQQTEDLQGWRLQLRPALGRLDRAIGRRQYHAYASVVPPRTSHDPQAWAQRTVDRGGTLNVQVIPPVGSGMPQEPEYPDLTPGAPTGFAAWHARLGNQIVEVHSMTGTLVLPEADLTAWGLLGTDQALPQQASPELWDVLLTSPQPLGLYGRRYFLGGVSGRTLVHPLEVLLACARSTGTFPADEYDVLPAKWGTAMPAAAFNLPTWTNAIGRTGLLRVPHLAIGLKGEPVRFRDWAERCLSGPWGFWPYVDHNGLIAVGHIAEAYPGDSWPALTADDLVAGSARLLPQLQETLSQQTYRYGHDLLTGQPTRIVRYLHPQAAGRLDCDDSELSWDVPGLDPDPGSAALSLLRARALTAARWWVTPLPRLSLAVELHRLELDLTAGVKVTCADVPNPFTGLRGFAAQPAVVVKRSLNFDRECLDLELILLPTPNVARVAPSGYVSAYAGGPPPVVTLTANFYTVAGGAHDGSPARDVLGFEQGDFVMLTDYRGLPRCDVAKAIAVAPETDGPNTLRLTSAWTLGGVPVVPVLGDRVRYCRWWLGAAPMAGWTAHMQQHVAAADATTGTLPDGTEPYVYGGV